MDINNWREKNSSVRHYAHFDSRVSLNQVWEYITVPSNIAKHSFYPFIHYIKKFNKYSCKSGVKPKERELCYSAHIDRCIFQYYGFLLNQVYDERVKRDGTDYSAIAYRDNLGLNNIHFAKKAIDSIRKIENCFIIVGDFTKFFDSLNHKYLKERLMDLLGTRGLPDDYYAVFKNITKFSTWNLESLLEINGLPDTKQGIKDLNQMERAISILQFKQMKKGNVHPNPNDYGIPQGSAISAVLSNIYMLSFDKSVNDFVSRNNGIYMRYSDDFIIVLPDEGKDCFKQELSYIFNQVSDIPGLELQTDKTQLFHYNERELCSCNSDFYDGHLNGLNRLDYLGFSFDGNVVTIRDKTISKYYYRMYRKLKTIVKNKGYTQYGHRINCKNIYLKYSEKGSNIGNGNFLTYVKRAESIFGSHEAITRSTKRHMQKIRRKLDLISKT